MINSKRLYKDTLEKDLIANNIYGIKKLSVKYKYLRRLRKTAYLLNTPRHGFINKIKLICSKILLDRLCMKTGWTIGPNCFGPGLVIAHYGTIVVNGSARFGENCVLQCGVNISEGVLGGDKIYLGTGAKIMKNITLASGIIVGANAVVTKSFETENIVIAGIPAVKISDNGFLSREDI